MVVPPRYQLGSHVDRGAHYTVRDEGLGLAEAQVGQFATVVLVELWLKFVFHQ